MQRTVHVVQCRALGSAWRNWRGFADVLQRQTAQLCRIVRGMRHGTLVRSIQKWVLVMQSEKQAVRRVTTALHRMRHGSLQAAWDTWQCFCRDVVEQKHRMARGLRMGKRIVLRKRNGWIFAAWHTWVDAVTQDQVRGKALAVLDRMSGRVRSVSMMSAFRALRDNVRRTDTVHRRTRALKVVQRTVHVVQCRALGSAWHSWRSFLDSMEHHNVQRAMLRASAVMKVMLTSLLKARSKLIAGRSFYHWRALVCADSLQACVSRADRARERCYSMLQTNAVLNRQLRRMQSVIHQRSELICQFDGMLAQMQSPYGTRSPSAKDIRLRSSTAQGTPQVSMQNSTVVHNSATVVVPR